MEALLLEKVNVYAFFGFNTKVNLTASGRVSAFQSLFFEIARDVWPDLELPYEIFVKFDHDVGETKQILVESLPCWK